MAARRRCRGKRALGRCRRGRLDSRTVFFLRSGCMSSAVPPLDRAIALACTLRTLRGRWLYVRCRCGRSCPHPVRLTLLERPERAGQTVADVLVGLRCTGCQGRRITVHLCEDAHGVGSLPKAIQPGWALLLHDAAGAKPPEPGSAIAAE